MLALSATWYVGRYLLVGDTLLVWEERRVFLFESGRFDRLLSARLGEDVQLAANTAEPQRLLFLPSSIA